MHSYDVKASGVELSICKSLGVLKRARNTCRGLGDRGPNLLSYRVFSSCGNHCVGRCN